MANVNTGLHGGPRRPRNARRRRNPLQRLNRQLGRTQSQRKQTKTRRKNLEYPEIEHGPPPILPSTQARREAAQREFATSQAGTKQQLAQAALNFGDPTLMAEHGVTTPNPMSALAQIARSEDRSKEQLGQSLNTANLFFSGRHRKDLGRITDEASMDRERARQEYLQAEQQLNQLIAEAQDALNAELASATAEELEAFRETEPEPHLRPEVREYQETEKNLEQRAGNLGEREQRLRKQKRQVLRNRGLNQRQIKQVMQGEQKVGTYVKRNERRERLRRRGFGKNQISQILRGNKKPSDYRRG